MTEQQEQQPVILTIDDQEYDVNELGNDSKIHYVEVVNLRKQLVICRIKLRQHSSRVLTYRLH